MILKDSFKREERMVVLQGPLNDRMIFDISEDETRCAIVSAENAADCALYPESNVLLLYDFVTKKLIAATQLDTYGYEIDIVRFQHGRLYTGSKKPRLESLRAWDMDTLEPLYCSLPEFYHIKEDTSGGQRYKGRLPRNLSFDGSWTVDRGLLIRSEDGKVASDVTCEFVHGTDSRGKYMLKQTFSGMTPGDLLSKEITLFDFRTFVRSNAEVERTDRIFREANILSK